MLFIEPQRRTEALKAIAASDAKAAADADAIYNSYGPVDPKTGLSVNHRYKTANGAFSPLLSWMTAGKAYRDAHKSEEGFWSGLDDFVNGMPGGWYLVAGGAAAIAAAPVAAGGFGVGSGGGGAIGAGAGLSSSAPAGGTFFGISQGAGGVTGLTAGAGGVTGLTATTVTTLGTGTIEAALASGALSAGNSLLTTAQQAKKVYDVAMQGKKIIGAVTGTGTGAKMINPTIPKPQTSNAAEFSAQTVAPSNGGVVGQSAQTSASQTTAVMVVIGLFAALYLAFRGA